MAKQAELQSYLASLPEVETARLPQGTIFTAEGVLYQVTEAGTTDFRKARRWRGDEKTEVALVPKSYLTNFMPLVARGRLLPVFPSREHLTEDGQPITFLFPQEQQALDSAYLDVALVRSGGVYVRNHGREPAFVVTDGVRIFRLYYYMRTAQGDAVSIGVDSARSTLQFRMSTHGPMHWRLLTTWNEQLPWNDDTRPSLSQKEAEGLRGHSDAEITQPIQPIPPTAAEAPEQKSRSEPTRKSPLVDVSPPADL